MPENPTKASLSIPNLAWPTASNRISAIELNLSESKLIGRKRIRGLMLFLFEGLIVDSDGGGDVDIDVGHPSIAFYQTHCRGTLFGHS